MNAKTIARAQLMGTKDVLRVAALPLTTTKASSLPGVGILAGSTRWAQIRMGFRTIPVALLLALAIWAYIALGLVLLVLAALVITQAIGQTHRAAVAPNRRRGLKRLAVNEGLVDETSVKGLKVLKTTRDAYGTTRRVRAPGSTTAAWQKKSDALAGKFGVPSSLFEIVQDPNDPPNVFTMWVGRPGGRKTREADVPQTVDFHADFRIGQSVAGVSVLARVFEHNTLIGGIPGMGKTATVRCFILHNLLDPEGETYLVDGKGSKKDYRAAAHAYSGYIDGNDDDALEKVEMMLNHLHGLINEANGNDTRLKILLVLDEWQDVRAGADKDTLKRIDTLLTRITKKGRATGFHIIIATQRASAISIRTEDRSLFRQGLAFRQKNGTDYGMVLGHAPTVGEPTAPGEAILMGDTGQTFVLVDHLSDQAWLTAAQGLTHRDPLRLTVTHEIDPLAQATHEAAQRLSESTVSPTDLWDAIAEPVRPKTPAVLGRWLAAQGVEKRGATYRVADLLEAFGGRR